MDDPLYSMQMAQELEVVEKSPEFINPYREDTKLVSGLWKDIRISIPMTIKINCVHTQFKNINYGTFLEFISM